MKTTTNSLVILVQEALKAKSINLSQNGTREVIRTTFEVILSELDKGRSVSIREFGRFHWKRSKASRGYNVHTKEIQDIEERWRLRWNPTTKARRSVDEFSGTEEDLLDD
ncbi:MAG: hypothetical protein BWK79_00700 [Beggiatoa sp. IS2]|nr:MAG: hypothetical protein BWK79_00700 [Beggiatoa sp. IS2]